jgi:hypothetical protein
MMNKYTLGRSILRQLDRAIGQEAADVIVLPVGGHSGRPGTTEF